MTKPLDLTALIALAGMSGDVDPPTYENGGLISIEDLRSNVDEVQEHFGAMDFHTKQSASLADPFDVVAEIERQLGAPLALCGNMVTRA